MARCRGRSEKGRFDRRWEIRRIGQAKWSAPDAGIGIPVAGRFGERVRFLRTQQCAKSQCSELYPVIPGMAHRGPWFAGFGVSVCSGGVCWDVPSVGMSRVLRHLMESLILAQDERWRRA